MTTTAIGAHSERHEVLNGRNPRGDARLLHALAESDAQQQAEADKLLDVHDIPSKPVNTNPHPPRQVYAEDAFEAIDPFDGGCAADRLDAFDLGAQPNELTRTVAQMTERLHAAQRAVLADPALAESRRAIEALRSLSDMCARLVESLAHRGESVVCPDCCGPAKWEGAHRDRLNNDLSEAGYFCECGWREECATPAPGTTKGG